MRCPGEGRGEKLNAASEDDAVAADLWEQAFRAMGRRVVRGDAALMDAARIAAAMDAEVFLLDRSPQRLRRHEADRRGRLVGNLLALKDLVTGKLDPKKILDL